MELSPAELELLEKPPVQTQIPASVRTGAEQLKTWTNTFLAETWQDAGETIEPTALTSRCEDYAPDRLPNNVIFLSAGADVQKDRIEMEIVGLGKDEESWGVEVVKTYGDTEKQDTWKRFANELTRRFKCQDGIELRLTAVAIDFHFKPAIVKQFAKSHGTPCIVVPVIGIGSTQPALTQRRTTQEDFHYSSVATDQAKDILYSRLRIDEAGSRFMHFPRGFGYDDGWFRQLTCERVVTKYLRGFPRRTYEKASGARNEALDMRVYWLALVDILRPDVGALEASIKLKPDENKEQIPVMPMRRGSWSNGWR
jgi:phage terminase large subunit GpA-like protein